MTASNAMPRQRVRVAFADAIMNGTIWPSFLALAVTSGLPAAAGGLARLDLRVAAQQRLDRQRRRFIAIEDGVDSPGDGHVDPHLR